MDITLENEETLGEVVRGIEDWLGDSGYTISEIEHDGRTIVPGDTPGWEHTSLDSIEYLNFTILSPGEKYAQDLHAVHQFTMLLHKALSSGNKDILKELTQEAPYVIDTLDSLLGEKATGYGKKLSDLMEAAGVNTGELTTRVQDLLTYTKNLSIILENRIKEVTAPFDDLKHTAATLRELNPKLMDVSVLLQTGKDREAMNHIIEFTEIADKLIRIYRILEREQLPHLAAVEVEGKQFESFYEELNNTLRELLQAFDDQDSVLIGDLLEYEIAPRTEQLQRFIEAIEKEQSIEEKDG
jgi:hypothetical protein